MTLTMNKRPVRCVSSLAYGNTMRDQDCSRQQDPLTVKLTVKETKTWS
jgi:hypothetical protein